MRAAFPLLVLTLAACSGARKVPVASDYDLACSTSDDCLALFVGAPDCCGDDCPNAAIRATESLRAKRDTWDATMCLPKEVCDSKPLCDDRAAYCSAGRCELWHHPSVISVDNYDRTCVTVDDCAAVFVGAPSCCGVDCPNTAVNANYAAAAASDVMAIASTTCPAAAHCPAAPVPCDGRLFCDEGLCRLASTRLDAGATDGGATN